MSWLYITLLAYFINAFAFIVDKYLLVSHIPRPFAYAFGVAILSASAVVLVPFGVVMQSAAYFTIALTSGTSFFIALIFLYRAIKASDISIAVTMSGAATAIFSFFLSILLLDELTNVANAVAIAVLVAGMLFLGRTDKKTWPLTAWAGFFFGVSFVLLKLSFDGSDFINGLFWTRVGFVGAALVSLVPKQARREILLSFRNVQPRGGAIFIGNKILAAAGFLLLYYAIRLGEVSVINSLLGLQFLFIFILALLFRSKIPRLEDNIDRKHIINKVVGIGFVIAGFLMVVIL